MDNNEFQSLIYGDTYKFIWENKHKPIIIGVGGSYAYGTNNENSDIDIRGIVLNTKEEILTNDNFEQYIDSNTDTTLYSFNKIIQLLTSCNPNVIEILGLNPEHYVYVNSIGQELLNNKKMFLSKKCIRTFGGYATSQLRRASTLSARIVGQEECEKYILGSIESAKYTFPEKYFKHPDNAINLYIDKAVHSDMITEIFMDVDLQHYPLRDYVGMWSELQTIVKGYSRLGKRNKSAVEHNKLGKHCCHLIRLYLMAIDILEKEEIITYRKNEHDLLMSIRNGDYINSDMQIKPEFYEMLDELEKRFEYAKNNTSLPESPDYKKINEFVMSVNEKIVTGEE